MNDKFTALVGTGAMDPQSAAMKADQLACQEEADAVIPDPYCRRICIPLHAQGDVATGRGEPGSLVEQIADDLHHANFIAFDEQGGVAELYLEVMPVALDMRETDLHGLFNQRRQ